MKVKPKKRVLGIRIMPGDGQRELGKMFKDWWVANKSLPKFKNINLRLTYA